MAQQGLELGPGVGLLCDTEDIPVGTQCFAEQEETLPVKEREIERKTKKGDSDTNEEDLVITEAHRLRNCFMVIREMILDPKSGCQA